MPTKLFLRNTKLNGISILGQVNSFDMLPVAGEAADTIGVVTTSGFTEVQWGSNIDPTAQWVSGRVPAGGFTLTSTDISIWARESNMSANIGGRYRLFKFTPPTTVVELAGGPFNDGVEFGTSDAEFTWIGNPTDTAFAENDRLILRLYITNVGTMGDNFIGTLTYNGADGTTGDSFLNIAETVAFKPEDSFQSPRSMHQFRLRRAA